MEYLIILIAALFHAVWNSIIKDSGDKLLTLCSIRAVGLVCGLGVIALGPPLELEAFPYLIGAVLIHYLYFWLLINAYQTGDFSQVYPIARGGAPVIVLILGTVFAGEHLSLLQVLAVLIISTGILSLALAKGRITFVPVSYALVTAAGIAGYTVVSGLGVRNCQSFLAYSGRLEVLTGLGLVLFTIGRRKGVVLDYARTNWAKGVVGGLLSISAFAAVLWAMKTAPLAPIAALRETSVIFAAMIGAFILKEGYAWQRILAAALVVLGIFIMTVKG